MIWWVSFYHVPLLLFLVGCVAGFVDSIAGGGGLLTIPAMIFLTGIDGQTLLGTNKGQAVFGTATSLTRYGHSPLLDWKRAKISFAPALAGAVVGVILVSKVPSKVLTPLVIFLLGAVAVIMIARRPVETQRLRRERGVWVTIAVAFGIAMYDGFFGPGTGMFLIVAYASLWHDSLNAASANAKVVNFASNIAAMAAFASRKLIIWKIALPMAAGQIIGGWTGAHVTIRKGQGLVRWMVVFVSLGLIARLGYRMATGR
jgi:uncharacterized protein